MFAKAVEAAACKNLAAFHKAKLKTSLPARTIDFRQATFRRIEEFSQCHGASLGGDNAAASVIREGRHARLVHGKKPVRN